MFGTKVLRKRLFFLILNNGNYTYEYIQGFWELMGK